MSALTESVMLVEGYDDRDFWRGLLLRLECKASKKAPLEHHGKSPAFTFETPSNTLVRLLPYNQAAGSGVLKGSELSAIAKLKLKEQPNKPMRRLLLSPDADNYPTLEAARTSVRDIVTSACPDATENSDGDFLVDGGKLIVSTLFVHVDTAREANGGLLRGVPAQPALEQLACAALCRVHPKRGEAVADWLASRPDPLGKDHKAHAWSFYAGWTTDHGTGDFYGSLWRDDRVAAVLVEILRAQSAWRVIESLLQP